MNRINCPIPPRKAYQGRPAHFSNSKINFWNRDSIQHMICNCPLLHDMSKIITRMICFYNNKPLGREYNYNKMLREITAETSSFQNKDNLKEDLDLKTFFSVLLPVDKI